MVQIILLLLRHENFALRFEAACFVHKTIIVFRIMKTVRVKVITTTFYVATFNEKLNQ